MTSYSTVAAQTSDYQLAVWAAVSVCGAPLPVDAQVAYGVPIAGTVPATVYAVFPTGQVGIVPK
jgi:hypothetical protein